MSIEWFRILIANFLLPLSVGVFAFLGTNYLSERRKRKRQSVIGAVILESFIEEIETSLRTMRGINSLLSNLPPSDPIGFVSSKSWTGINSISDEYLERIVYVSKDIKPDGFPPDKVRIHFKNYFGNVCDRINEIVQLFAEQGDWQTPAKNYLPTYTDAGESVLKMAKQTRQLLLENSKRIFPK